VNYCLCWPLASTGSALCYVLYLSCPGFMAGGIAAGGQLTTTTEIENFPGFPHVCVEYSTIFRCDFFFCSEYNITPFFFYVALFFSTDILYSILKNASHVTTAMAMPIFTMLVSGNITNFIDNFHEIYCLLKFCIRFFSSEFK